MSEKTSSQTLLSHALLGKLVPWLAVVVVLIIPTVISKGAFIQPTNLLNLLRQASFVGMVAVGQTMVIITGGIDLSVGSTMAVGSVVSTKLLVAGYGVGQSILAALVAGLLIGAVNGLLVSKGKIPPFIATLGMMGVARSLAYIISGGSNVYKVPQTFGILGRGKIGPIPTPILIWVAVFIVGLILLNRSRIGRAIFAIGGNQPAARLAGINVAGTQFLVYAATGLVSALAGVVMASRLIMGEPTVGPIANLESIAAAVIGGTSLYGGVGSLIGAFAGTVVLATLDNMMNIMMVDVYLQTAAKSLLVVIAVFGYERIRRMRLGQL